MSMSKGESETVKSKINSAAMEIAEFHEELNMWYTFSCRFRFVENLMFFCSMGKDSNRLYIPLY